MTSTTEDYDIIKSGELTTGVWLRLAHQLADQVPNLVIEGNARRALEWARYADACFYQATGEGEGATVKELLQQDRQP